MKEEGRFEYYYVEVAPSEQVPLHQQPTWELSYVVLGRGQRLLGNTRSDFSSGDLVLIPPGMRHCWYFNPDYTDSNGHIVNISIMIYESVINGLKTLMPPLSVPVDHLMKSTTALTFDNEDKERISNLMMDMRNMDELNQSKSVIDILFIILGGIDKAGHVGNISIYDETRERLKQINLYVSCHFMRPISTADVAQHIGINKSSFCIFFKRCMGQAFVNFLNDYRLNQAVFLLGDKSKKRTIADICFEVGFQSVPHFNHLFKKKFGCSPKQLI